MDNPAPIPASNPAAQPAVDRIGRKVRILILVCAAFAALGHAVNLELTVTPDVAFAARLVRAIQAMAAVALGPLAAPMLFVLAGYVFFHDGDGRPAGFAAAVRARCRTLALPWLAWSLWCLVGLVAIDSLGATSPEAEPAPWWAILAQPVPPPLAFVRDCFIAALAAPVLRLALTRRSIAAPVLATLAMCWLQRPLDVDLCALFFIPLGGAIALHRPWLVLRQGDNSLLLAAWLGLAGAAIWWRLVHGAHLPSLTGVAILLGMLACSQCYDRCEAGIRRLPLDDVARWALALLAAQWPVHEALKRGAVTFIGSGDGALLVAFALTPVIALGICMSLAAAARRWAPPFYRLAVARFDLIGP